MNNFRMRAGRLVASVVALLVLLTASAFAADSDWADTGYITVEGTGVMPTNTLNINQAKMLARRAATVDAYRQIAEQVNGVSVDGDTTIENLQVTSDVVRSRTSAVIKNARIKNVKYIDGGCVVTVEVPVFGVSGSLASAVFESRTARDSFPTPVESVVPSTPASYDDFGYTPSRSTTSTKPVYSDKGTSAAPAPSGRAIGSYTGLIVDCRGLGLKPAMSPVIKNAAGTAIYGYKNLDYDAIVEQGMAGYTRDINNAARAGSNPLIVRAEAVANNGANPVLSTADANRVLIENGATGFLDGAKVVFVR